ncbi:hypothetical protein BLA60_11885 [Actinophytocola xinjiangensis]|uniref:DUF998 domain-containing protein n=1 Tax=Actinophytocola xinjiangensis TaxID=485602 RepID=A0A7Z1AZW0_9PSEU|nr:DUF998 domain-containing protein [Actinophytocola xinjiangensis]OLF11628.1 hypothetical protein BLA60_11885 [Actinophytocola xinjiangensis]
MPQARAVTTASLAALLLGVTLMLALHVVPPTNEVNPIRSTLSQYALGPGKWAFDIAVLLVALGSALALHALVRARAVRARSAGTLFGSLWVVSLLVLVYFTKTDWSVGPSLGGTIHRYASVVAFVSLPIAVLVIARAVFATAPGWRAAAQGLGALSLGFFGLIVIGAVRMAAGGGPWWTFVPLGLVERAIAFSGVAAIVVVVLGSLVRAGKSEELSPAAA